MNITIWSGIGKDWMVNLVKKIPSNKRLSETVFALLEDVLRQKKMPLDKMLTIKVLAAFFKTSRTPMQSALNQLVDLGMLVTEPNKGYILPEAHFSKVSLLTETDLVECFDWDFSLVENSQPHLETVGKAFRQHLIAALPYGRFWVNEREAAAYFDVSRTIIREYLLQFYSQTLVSKDSSSHWVVGPLTAQMIGHYYELRRLLEVAALRSSSAYIMPGEIVQMLTRIDNLANYDSLSVEDLVAIDRDLHQQLLRYCPNRILMNMLEQTQITLSITSLFFDRLPPQKHQAMLNEHRMIGELLLRGAIDSACSALDSHITLSGQKMKQWLKTFSVFPKEDIAPFLREVDGLSNRY